MHSIEFAYVEWFLFQQNIVWRCLASWKKTPLKSRIVQMTNTRNLMSIWYSRLRCPVPRWMYMIIQKWTTTFKKQSWNIIHDRLTTLAFVTLRMLKTICCIWKRLVLFLVSSFPKKRSKLSKHISSFSCTVRLGLKRKSPVHHSYRCMQPLLSIEK